MIPAIAIVGMACRYPDAGSPEELWENVLAQRRAFRRLPPERLNTDDYWSDDRDAPDGTYAVQAAVLEGYTFDRVRFRVSGSTYRAADLAHWLALDVAARALDDAGFPDGDGLPREAMGVVLGNTLTGEFSRANAMRLRWPYVRRVLAAALAEEGWMPAQRHAFLERLEVRYKAPFPPVGAETLAGGLSNTIAGRICNYFDLHGGGYTVDGACASSLLAVTHACTALAAGDLQVALAGGVDLSLDPFELVGFAKTGALAAGPMRVYDTRSDGFIPGEGCGFVVLMPHEEALRQGRRVYALIRGWGVSSDGAGGITRPDVEGQLLALQRAYRRAAFGPETVALFEGHGTGTRVGDAVELRVLAQARRDASAEAPPAVVGSVKANIGHTKAAAGLAGLLKATMALHHQLLPPTTGCETPHPELTGEASALRMLREGEPWPAQAPLRAGVSAMGFGGINTHVVLEGTAPRRRGALHARESTLRAAAQDAELFLLGARDRDGLRRQVTHLLAFASRLSLAELTDLAAHLAASLDARAARGAVVAATPAELAQRLGTLAAWLAQEGGERLETGVYLGLAGGPPRIGFLFPGQGAPAHLGGGAWRRRFEAARVLYAGDLFPREGDGVATDVAQPAIVTASVAGLRLLEHCGVTACTAIGHSLGELTALHWAGAFDEAALLKLAALRGRAMADLGGPIGAMASVAAGPQEVEALIGEAPVVLAGLNGPLQTVVSGAEDAVDVVLARARSRGWNTRKLRVSHAFHSPLVAAAATPLAAHLAGMTWQPLQRAVVSTVTGRPLTPDEDLAALLCRQVTAPVRFAEALTTASEALDLWIEVGPGHLLSTLAKAFLDVPAIATDAGGASLRGWLEAVGAAFAFGAPVRPGALFEGRFTRPFSLDWQPRFFVNPCELAPASDPDLPPSTRAVERPQPHTNGSASPPSATIAPSISPHPASVIDLIRRLVAERAELPQEALRDEDRLLSDLHLNSITVSELLVEAGRRLDLAPSAAPTNYADATLAEVAEALEARARFEEPASRQETARAPAGVDAWIRPFTVALVEKARPRAQRFQPKGAWQILAPPGYPLKTRLQEAFDGAGPGDGVVVGLPPDPVEAHVPLLLEGARAAMTDGAPRRFVLVQHGGEAAAFARTLHLEAPHVTVCVVDVPVDHPEAAAWVLAEAQAATGYVEAHYDATGARREPRLRLLPLDEPTEAHPLGPDDVLLVTGGGKGITAACALAIGRETGARLVLLGRSRPAEDAEVAATLARMNGVGLRCRYVAADVTDAGAVRAAVAEAEAHVGPVTAVLHGAARNVPQRLGALDEADVLATLAPKVQGLRHVLAAIDPGRLRLLLTFGSIIARMGLPGEAHYALANASLARLTERWQQAHPRCRCLTVEWSIWSEVGMGTRLGSLDALLHRGVLPIAPDEGVAMLRRLLARPPDRTAVVVTGRFGDPPTLKVEQPELPFLRFLEQPRVHVPGVELVVEAQLSSGADPYLDDHVLQGERLLPAVMGLEAMAQVATALADRSEAPVFEDVTFNRPVVVPEGAATTIRVAALVRAPGVVEVALRSESTAFQTDHFRATCRFGVQALRAAEIPEITLGAEPVPLHPDRDLYGGILFHQGRFQRLRGYRHLRATACVAEIAPDEAASWFGRYLPADLVLGDPGARDAAIHAIQACIPHATLVPVGVERLTVSAASEPGPRLVHAQERAHEGGTFVYDVSVTAADGRVVERWEGLRLRRVGQRLGGKAWAAPLLGPYLERRMQELTPAADVSVAVLQNGAAARRARSDRAIRQALGAASPIQRRTNGKPEAADARNVSAAHAGELTLAVAGAGPLGCDVEPVRPRPEALWRDLLGPGGFDLAGLIAQEAKEDFDTAATRVWTALESLKKAAVPPGTPLVLDAVPGDGWVTLAAGRCLAATFVTEMQGREGRLVCALLTESCGATAPASCRFALHESSNQTA